MSQLYHTVEQLLYISRGMMFAMMSIVYVVINQTVLLHGSSDKHQNQEQTIVYKGDNYDIAIVHR